ncbi:MAG: ABC transporter permease [Anaerolineales bacterium]|nr:ABC transporter permease [Anaerolineales bacterium]
MRFSDMWTVMWKEMKGIQRYKGSRTKSLLGLAIPMAMLGIYLPLQIGRALVEGPWSLLIAVFIPMMMVGMTIPESFAGERERHTLETLLASPLTDRAILFGKVAVSVGYSWGITMMLLLVSLVMVNIIHWDGQVLFYTPIMTLANVALSLLLAILVAGIGVLKSLRAATVQDAQQSLMTATLFPLVLLQMIPLLLLNVVPDGRALLIKLVEAANPTQIILIAMTVFVVSDLGLLMTAVTRFQRARLILD